MIEVTRECVDCGHQTFADPLQELDMTISKLETEASFTPWMENARELRAAFDRLRTVRQVTQ